MGMKTDFRKDSRTWAFWNDMLALAREEGVPAAKLERAVDRGFYTGFSLNEPVVTNRKGVIERAEVFQYAYEDKRYYPLLARHGFPVPFAMDDFAGDGGADDAIRAEVASEIARLRADIAAGEAAPEPGSDAHRRAMALGLCEYLWPKFRYGRDCRFERVDWDAIKGRCGMCSERSFALFYALKEAELAPRFLFLGDLEPTLDAMGAMISTEDPGTYHILLGIPMSDGSMLQLDLQRHDFETGYAYAKEGPAWFGALAYLSNLGNSNVSEERREQAIAAAVEMAPREWLFDELRLRRMVKDISAADLKAELDAMRRRNPGSPEIDAVAAVIETSHALKHDTSSLTECLLSEKLVLSLRSLDKKHPAASAHIRSMIVKGLVASLERNMARAGTPQEFDRAMDDLVGYAACLMEIIRPAVEARPTSFLTIFTLVKAASWAMSNSEQADLYRELMGSHPGHRFFMNLYAEACLNAFVVDGKVQKAPDTRELKRLRNEGAAVLRKLIDLEPGDSSIRLLSAKYAMWANEHDLMKEELLKAAELRPKDYGRDKTVDLYLLMNAMFRDDTALIKSQTKVLKRTLKDDPRANLMRSLLLGLIALIDSNKSLVQRESVRSAAIHFEAFADRFWKPPEEMTAEERYAYRNVYDALHYLFYRHGESVRASVSSERVRKIENLMGLR